MRVSSAVVLSTLAVGQAAAANARHASFHARREAERKRTEYDTSNVNWADVAYDLSGVDWSSVFASTPAAATPTAAATSAAVKVQQAAAKATSAATPAYTEAASSSTQEKAASSSKSSISSELGDLVTGVEALVEGLESVLSQMTVTAWTTGKNDVSNNGQMWLGNDSDWTVTFSNANSDTISVWCWNSEQAMGGTVIANQPYITANLKSGESTTVSWAGGVGSACAAVYPDTKPSSWGAIYNTWFEVTFKDPSNEYSVGAFDVSYEPCTAGTAITAVGSQCTSDATTCVFKCKGDVDHCGDAGTYQLENCDAGNGGGADTAAANGGCNTANDSENIKVTFH